VFSTSWDRETRERVRIKLEQLKVDKGKGRRLNALGRKKSNKERETKSKHQRKETGGHVYIIKKVLQAGVPLIESRGSNIGGPRGVCILTD